jgi:hypothetical protein
MIRVKGDPKVRNSAKLVISRLLMTGRMASQAGMRSMKVSDSGEFEQAGRNGGSLRRG